MNNWRQIADRWIDRSKTDGYMSIHIYIYVYIYTYIYMDAFYMDDLIRPFNGLLVVRESTIDAAEDIL